MSLRGRLTLMSALIVGVVLAAAAVVCFAVMRHELRGQVDDQLTRQAKMIQQVASREPAFPERLPQLPRPPSQGRVPFSQFIRPTGTTIRRDGEQGSLVVTSEDLAVARGRHTALLQDRRVAGTHLRVITVPVKGRGAAQSGLPLDSVDSALASLRLVLGLLIGGGIALAALLSRLFARRVIAPISALTAATEHVEATGDLRRRVQTGGNDEVGRLASRFNAMLERVQQTQVSLEASTAAQRQLVADASHELRTPIAGLRTNIEVLLASRNIEAGARKALLADLVEQTDELSAVVADVIELARGDQPAVHAEELDLGAIAREAVIRARLHAPGVEFREQIEPWLMVGVPERLGRAVNNLLANAAKFSPQGSTVELYASGGELSVRDHGPGIPREDLPHIFDRFFRARDASPMQGSGLGLAIVKQVVEAHGGTVAALPAEGGGLTVHMRFPSTGSDDSIRRHSRVGRTTEPKARTVAWSSG